MISKLNFNRSKLNKIIRNCIISLIGGVLLFGGDIICSSC